MQPPIDPTAEFKSKGEIGNVLVGASPTGVPVYLRDLVEKSRGYESPRRYLNYAVRGQIPRRQYRDALSDMELAIRADFLSSDKIFTVEGVSLAQKASKACTWSLGDFATLTAAMPSDFRPVLLRALYWIFFTTFGKEDHNAKALQDFQRAAALNPKSPLPPYFIGRMYTKMSFWTKAAWASDKQRDDISRKAIPAYTAAVQLDSKFLPAYEERASAYLGLKQHKPSATTTGFLNSIPKTQLRMLTGAWRSLIAASPLWAQHSIWEKR